MNAPISPILVQPNGSFRCVDNGQTVIFRHGNGDPAEIANMPEGSWPFAHRWDGTAGEVYFTCFLSSVVHRWRLDSHRICVADEPVPRDELAPLLRRWRQDRPQDPDGAWLCMKLLDAPLTPQALPAGPLGCFAELERRAACIIREETGHHATTRFVADLVAVARDHHLAPGTALRFSLVPDERFSALPIAAGIWNPQDSQPIDSQAFDRATLQRLAEFIAAINVAPEETGMAFEIAGLVDRHVGLVTVTCDLLHVADRRCKVCSVELPLHLLINTSAAYPERVKIALRTLHPFLIRFFERQHAWKPLRFDFSDITMPEHIGFDRPKGAAVTLLPDLYLLLAASRSIEYHVPAFEDFASAFMARRCVAFWRGSSTGNAGQEITTLDAFIANQRVQGCLALARLPHGRGDGKITAIVQTSSPEVKAQAQAFLDEHGMHGTQVAEHRFAAFQIYIDFPGNASAWGSFKKYLMGCLVLRPQHDFELAYYHLLESGTHYIELAADLGNLDEVTDWVARNQLAAARIAYEGRRRMIEIVQQAPALIETAFAHATEI